MKHSEQTKDRIRESMRVWRLANPRSTEMRDRQIVTLRQQGVKQEAIAAELGLTQSRISQILRHLAQCTP